MEPIKFEIGDRVRFHYCDEDSGKEIQGIGRIKDIEIDNGVVHVQTTIKLHWMEFDAITNFKKYLY